MNRRKGASNVNRWLHHLAIDIPILAAWLIFTGFVVHYERGSLWGSMVNINELLVGSNQVQDQWFGIYYKDQKIGHAQTTIRPGEMNTEPGTVITDRGIVVFNLMGRPQTLSILSKVFIDSDWRLRSFAARIKGEDYELNWKGARQGDVLEIEVSTPTSKSRSSLKDPSGSAFVSVLTSWAAFHRLSPGQSGQAWLINPLALSPELATFFVRRVEEVDGIEALVVETDVSGMKTTTWVTRDGEILREISPLGWELRKETEEDSLSWSPESASLDEGFDILLGTAISVDADLEQLGTIQKLVLLAKGVKPEAINVERDWQTILPPEKLSAYGYETPSGPWCLIELKRPDMKQQSADDLQEIEKYRLASVFVQSDHADIINKANEIVGEESDSWKQTLMLNRWVNESLTKQLTIGLPSAIDVLNKPIGDCHEHTVLFTALARSLGIPTRMIGGLVYQHGWLYYHAWPEVWVGRWHPIDPTLGQQTADITHIGLIEAEASTLVQLSQFIGQLEIEVIEIVRDPATNDEMRPEATIDASLNEQGVDR